MGVVGKIVGGTIGFALGGPLGAIAGAVFGHAFDSSTEELNTGSGHHLSDLESTQLAFFVGTFSMLAKIIKADGQVSHAEIDSVEAFAVKDLHLPPADREVAFNIFRTALESPASFEDFAHQFHQHFQHQPQLMEMLVDILFRVSLADGALNAVEETLIISAVDIFNIEDFRYRQIRARYVGSSDQAYQVLGCRSSDPDETIKQQYRTLVQSYHPDKIASKGLPDEFVQLAHEKFREIQEAYEKVKKERGIK
jgi:DnaJ like chaperone protein